MTDEEILALWDRVNHSQTVTQQLFDFARLVEKYINRRESLVNKLMAELGETK